MQGLHSGPGGWEALLPYECEACGWKVNNLLGIKLHLYVRKPEDKQICYSYYQSEESIFLCEFCAKKKEYPPKPACQSCKEIYSLSAKK